MLEVPGRSSGAIRRTPRLTTSLDRREYLVALAKESQWVRDVRANDGLATITRTKRRRARLAELPPSEGAPAISAYLARDEDGNQARYYFGLEPNPSIAAIESIGDRYPVFRIDNVGSAPE